VKRFSWVTDLPAVRDRLMETVRCARRRRAIGNGTFRTVKARDGYGFGTGFGHGKNRLSDVMGTLGMPAFPVDGTLACCRKRVRKAPAHRKRRLCCWDRMRELLRTFTFPDWGTFCRPMAGTPDRNSR